jgi:hypothetical protein
MASLALPLQSLLVSVVTGERRLRHAGKTGGSIGTFVVWIYMYVRRISFIRASGVAPGQLSTPGALTQGVTRRRCRIRRTNLKNRFEIPVIFCALALYLFVTATVDATYVGAAWVFAIFRVLHSAVHCTFNLVMLRFYLYLVSTLAVWFVLARAAFAHFGG